MTKLDTSLSRQRLGVRKMQKIVKLLCLLAIFCLFVPFIQWAGESVLEGAALGALLPVGIVLIAVIIFILITDKHK